MYKDTNTQQNTEDELDKLCLLENNNESIINEDKNNLEIKIIELENECKQLREINITKLEDICFNQNIKISELENECKQLRDINITKLENICFNQNIKISELENECELLREINSNDNSEKLKNKLISQKQELHIINDKYTNIEKENKILKQKYEFIKNEYNRLREESFNTKIYNNNKSLLEQNNILVLDNKTLINELYDAKKENQNLTQKLKFNEIEHDILTKYHNKYKEDTNQQIYNLELNFGLVFEQNIDDEIENNTDVNEETDENEYSDVETEQNISVFIDTKGIKKMLLNGKNYKLINQNIDIKNKNQLQKEYMLLHNKYLPKKK